MTVTITEQGLYEMPNDVYHSDPVPAGSLSVSGAKTLIQAPAKFKWQRDHPVHRDVFDFGSVAHALALNDPTVDIAVIDKKDWRAAGAAAEKAEAREAGRVPILVKDLEVIEAMVAALQAHPLAMELLSVEGKSEQSAFWQDDETGVWRRARFDWLPTPVEGQTLIVSDYKTARSSDPDQFARAAADYGYYQQAAWYCDAVKALGIHPDPAFAFIVQEKEAPYIVTVIQLDYEAMQLGERHNRQALELFAECTANDSWPGYRTDVAHVSLPTYFTRKHEDAA